MKITPIVASQKPPTPVTGSVYFDLTSYQMKMYYKGRWENIEAVQRDLLKEFFTDIEWTVL